MKSLLLLLTAALATAALSVPALEQTKTQQIQTRLVGSSSCTQELEHGRFSVRLDKSQNAFIVTATTGGKHTAAIVQYSSAKDNCGVVRDVVQSERKSAYFELECSAAVAPTDVAVGIRNLSESGRKGYSLEGWRVDLKRLRFVRVGGKVFCTPSSYAGNDDGDDLATWAMQRGKKPK
jgi:hypothetical protein